MLRSLALLMVCLVVIVLLPSVHAIEPLERVPISSQRLVNAFNSPVGSLVNVNQQVQVAADVTNMQTTAQEFVYIVQIRNSADVIVSLGWATGNLQPSQTFTQARSWTPDSQGTYTAEIFVWKSFIEPEALSAEKVIFITVS